LSSIIEKNRKKYADNKTIYRHRSKIESVFGNVKSEGRDYFNMKMKKLAIVYAYRYLYYSGCRRDLEGDIK
jgi:hypothetical protein